MILNSEFKPAWWLRGQHMQTIWPALFRRQPKPQRRRERIELADGDFIDLDWADGNPKSPIVIILHGLCGSSNSVYAAGLQKKLQKRNWRSVVMNFRGCSGEYNRLPRSYHSGETEDIQTIFNCLQQREPNTLFFVVGYSLGGNVLLKWLGENKSIDNLKAAVAVSVPFKLNLCADHMDSGFSKVYRNRFIRNLRKTIIDKKQLFENLGQHEHLATLNQLNDISQYKSFWEFDDKVTAKLHGFNSADDYYAKCSSYHYVQYIQTPTLIIQSKNDPILHSDSIPNPANLSPMTQLEISSYGGHVGFINGKIPFKPNYWLEERIPNFLQTKMESS